MSTPIKSNAQLFGSFTSVEREYLAMLCRDADQPAIAVLSWWAEGIPGRAARVLLESAGATGSFRLKLLVLYNVDQAGGLIVPSMSKEELDDAALYTVILRESAQGGYIGTWAYPNSLGGSIVFHSANESRDDGKINVTTCNDWDDFKRWATEIRRAGATAFRGHGSNAFRLQSTIHRAGRARLERYYTETLENFRHHVEATLGLSLSLSNSTEYAILLGLAQHHGLPSPLLDFSESAYIAAYFAFSDAIENRRPDVDEVRIYAIDGEFIDSISNNVVLATAHPYIRSLTISAKHNPRLYVQQGRFLVTNVIQLEQWLRLEENRTNKKILFAADVPVHCAGHALEDLKYMGLTAGTLFPGIDGICRMMRQTILLSSVNSKIGLAPMVSESLQDQPMIVESTQREMTNAEDKPNTNLDR